MTVAFIAMVMYGDLIANRGITMVLVAVSKMEIPTFPPTDDREKTER